jgi:hypothetical protein
VLDGIMMRYILEPLLRIAAQRSPAALHYPPGMRFMLEKAWARRSYHVLVGGLLLVLWWYLGSPAGATLVR